MPDHKRIGGLSLLEQLPTERLVDQGQLLLGLLAERAIEKAFDSVDALTDRLLDYAHHGGPGLITAITGGGTPAEDKPALRETVKSGVSKVSENVRRALAGVSGPEHRDQAATTTMNIAEQIDVGVPIRLAYDRWTRFQNFSQFMKMVSSAENSGAGASDGKVQIYCTHPDWDTTIIEQIPDEKIMWRSRGVRGRVGGVVSFHAVTPNMTRILLVLEYQPQGLLERAGKLWHAQERRVRLEIKHFQCHVMTRALRDSDSTQENQGPAEVPDASAEDYGDAAEEHNDDYDDNVDGSAEESDDYADMDDTYNDADGAYDNGDDEYDNEPERSYVPSGRR